MVTPRPIPLRPSLHREAEPAIHALGGEGGKGVDESDGKVNL